MPFHRAGRSFRIPTTTCRRRHARRVRRFHERKLRGRGGFSCRDLYRSRCCRLGCGLHLGWSFDCRCGRSLRGRARARWPGRSGVRLVTLSRGCRCRGRRAQPARHQVQTRCDGKGRTTDQQRYRHCRPPPEQARPTLLFPCSRFDTRKLWARKQRGRAHVSDQSSGHVLGQIGLPGSILPAGWIRCNAVHDCSLLRS